MFQFTGFAFYPYVFRIKYLHLITRIPKPQRGQEPYGTRSLAASKFQLSKVGFPIRKSTDHRLFAPHRRLSQRTTSFIASYCQGIHQMPLSRLIALISNAHPSCVGGVLSDTMTRQVNIAGKTRKFSRQTHDNCRRKRRSPGRDKIAF